MFRIKREFIGKVITVFGTTITLSENLSQDNLKKLYDRNLFKYVEKYNEESDIKLKEEQKQIQVEELETIQNILAKNDMQIIYVSDKDLEETKEETKEDKDLTLKELRIKYPTITARSKMEFLNELKNNK